jgi:hypothetical protein
MFPDQQILRSMLVRLIEWAAWIGNLPVIWLSRGREFPKKD